MQAFNPNQNGQPRSHITKNAFQRARQVFDWFIQNRGRFLCDSENCYLLFDQVAYRLPDDPRLGSLILKKTGQMNVNRQCGKFWRYLTGLCREEGRKIRRPGWICVDPEKDTLCVHLHDEQNRILELRSGKVEYGCNYFNRAGALLMPIERMRPIEFIPEASPEQAVAELKKWVVDALPIHYDLRWMVVSWLLTAFFHDCKTERCMLKFSGPPGSGKTTAARLLSCLLYGGDFVESRSAAYYKEQAATLPLLICDLPRGQEVDAKLGHFLNASSSGSTRAWIEKGKPKRAPIKALAIVTSTGPIRRADAAGRAYEMHCMPVKKLKGFSEHRQLLGLIENRSLILSGMFRLFASDVLRGLDRRCSEMQARLEERYGLGRGPYLVGYFTLVAIILRAIMGVHYRAERAEEKTQELIECWVQNQQKA